MHRTGTISFNGFTKLHSLVGTPIGYVRRFFTLPARDFCMGYGIGELHGHGHGLVHLQTGITIPSADPYQHMLVVCDGRVKAERMDGLYR